MRSCHVEIPLCMTKQLLSSKQALLTAQATIALLTAQAHNTIQQQLLYVNVVGLIVC